LAKFAIKDFNVNTDNEELLKDVEDVFKSEANTLDELSGLSHPNLIQRIAAITRGHQRYLMFLWADGGNLRDLWVRDPKPALTPNFIREVILQLRGMAEALHKLHDYKDRSHYRHGDIKPENILSFTDGSRLGVLKISDMGSAKHHNIATRLREHTRSKTFATMAYQPPESRTNIAGATSRLGDLWSMGCVILEFMIWLLYGYDKLKAFNAELKSHLDERSAFFEVVREDQEDNNVSRLVARLHPLVQACIDQLHDNPECAAKFALGQLLDIVETKLLVVDLPERTESAIAHGRLSITDDAAGSKAFKPFGRHRHRSNAAGLVGALDAILNGNGSESIYWLTGRSRHNSRLNLTIPHIAVRDETRLLSPTWMPTKHNIGDSIRPPIRADSAASSSQLSVPQRRKVDQDYSRVHELSNDWSYPIDNAFVNRMIQNVEQPCFFAPEKEPSQLCKDCKKLDLLNPSFHIHDAWSDLESRKQTCKFCELRWDVAKNLDRTDYTSVSFEKVESTLTMNEGNVPVFSLCQGPQSRTSAAIQMGLPQLHDARSAAHFETLRQWLKNCNEHHQGFKCQLPEGTTFLPTRLINVGPHQSATVRLHETRPSERFKYLALSHPWGTKPPWFCTFRKNVENFKKGINVGDMPATFRDAIQITRELGYQYLWIDSLCIIQRDESDNGDFDKEAASMEKVFGLADCVLAASSARRQKDGLLNEREGSQRPFVSIPRPNDSPLYVCRFLDNFNDHVLEGPLNRRGWVMQERVLARRTIFFTDKQTYWQCGEGVRCETLTRMDK
jgi:serine/threonine protein kinase